MAPSPGRQMPTNSSHVIRTPIAVLPMAPFSPDREVKYCSRQRPAKAQSGSKVPRRGAGFESLEPTSPKVGCMGQIKLKQKYRDKATNHSGEKNAGQTTKGNLLSKIKKFIFGSHGGGGPGDFVVASSGDCPTEEGCRTPYPLLGQLKRYTASGLYDAEFSDTYTRQQPYVDPSGSLSNGSIGGSG